MKMNKGEIFFGKNNLDGRHPIVYLRDNDKNFFIGAMLTTSDDYPNNILMAEEHFKKEDPKGEKYELFFKGTYLIATELIKRDEWKPFRKVGELTDEGIRFVESKISNTKPKLWEDYRNVKE